MPRVEELTMPQATAMNQWRERGESLVKNGQYPQTLDAAAQRSAWMINVLRDHFEAHYRDAIAEWDGSKFKIQGNDETSADFLVAVGRRRFTVHMIREEGQWRVEHGIPEGSQ
jgi:hypothetical protein